MTAIKLDDVILQKDDSHGPTISMGYDWITSISVATEAAHKSGIAALLLDVQNLGPKFKQGAVVADYESELEDNLGAFSAEKDNFEKLLADTLVDALPGLRMLTDIDGEKRRLDTGLLLSVYGALADRLPLDKRAHLVDADVQTGKLAKYGDPRSSIMKFIGRRLETVRAFPRESEETVYPDDVAAIALRAVKTYTEMVRDGELEIQSDRGMAIFNTMSALNTSIWGTSDFWADENEDILNDFDTIMEDFQKTVVNSPAYQRSNVIPFRPRP
ncbi:hypothetical protein HFN89_04950 [Rhizobium laguerreae]|nr:hypothetical protein [Rhizobium laguerreae]